MQRITSIWQSFRTLPLWVQIWVAFILTPINACCVLFLDTLEGQIATILCFAGMLPNLIIIWVQRGFSRAMAFPHLPFWTILDHFDRLAQLDIRYQPTCRRSWCLLGSATRSGPYFTRL